MTSLVDTVHETSEEALKYSLNPKNTSFTSHRIKHVLKLKQNTLKLRCNKELKRKLKKYKLRHDGKEDQDVLDVTNILVSSLIIKSPNSKAQNRSQSDIEYIDFIRPRNYLFKMGKRNTRTDIVKPVKNKKVNTSNEINVEEIHNSLVKNNSQEKKHTNAFQLLMDSRNKSIGSNSPGKEKTEDDVETNGIVEKKDLKTKRLLILQRMAEVKGSLKKIEMEEYQDKCIKKKMEKRAEKLKSMILNHEPKTNKETRGKKLEKVKIDKTAVDKSIEVKNTKVKKFNTLQLVNIFNECENQMNISPEKKQIPKEDEEFLKKLSPSLKKKENMLSYFKKIEKETEHLASENECDNMVIKVKLTSKNKKKGKRKLSLKKDTSIVNEAVLNNENNIKTIESVSPQSDELSHEQQQNLDNAKIDDAPTKTEELVLINEERPKRSIKRPVKYIDDLYLTSSDEELHIFTPKKKKLSENKVLPKTLSDDTKHSSIEKPKKINKEKHMHKEDTHKKPVKLAPIFATKTQPNLADIEAKQKFLQSGVPEQLKKIISQQRVTNSVSTCFPVVVHVQQKTERFDYNQQAHNIPLVEIIEKSSNFQEDESLFKSLINVSKLTLAQNHISRPTENVNNILHTIKQLNPKFPVYRTYHLIKNKSKGDFKETSYLDLHNSVEIMNSVMDISNENLDQLNWTAKYKPTSSKQIIGNFESIKELRKWLVQWTENEAKTKNNKNESDSSDFYLSDTDSRGSMKGANNILIITGPVGCGKTSSVYAVAAELAIKVIEVNASSKRTGKIMLQDLHEATQSHKVNRGASSADNSQKSLSSQEIVEQCSQKNINKRGRPKKNKEKSCKKSAVAKTEISSSSQLSQDSSRTAMSLILIDDADIVFEQDDGFCSAIVQLVNCSKRPVILITSSLSCQHLQRFFQTGKMIKMNPLLPKMLGTWLDLLCLANNGVTWPGLGAKFLDYFKGDIRKTINYLQFYTQTECPNDEIVTPSQNQEVFSENVDEEKSNMSWVDHDDIVEGTDASKFNINYIWTCFTNRQLDLAQCVIPVELLNIWWSLPNLLHTKTSNVLSTNAKGLCNESEQKSLGKTRNGSKDKDILKSLAIAIDAVSVSDYFNKRRPNRPKACVTSQPWYSAETNSVSEQDNIDNYMRSYELYDEISYEYVKDSIFKALKSDAPGSGSTLLLEFPGMTKQRERNRIVSRHNNLTSCLNPSAALDRRGLALDYWSTCRTICRIEKTKTDSNSKRNNRFCHYLKSMNATCKSNSFDNLADSLCFNK